MDTIWYGVFGIAALMGLIAVRVPIAVSLFAVSFVGLWTAFDLRMAFGMMTTVTYPFAASWTLSAVPLFLFMGYVAFHSGLTQGLFNAAKAWLSSVPGGLAVASIFACGGFATVTGSSIACSAAMGRIAVPEMEKAGYHPSISTGSIAAGGTIGALIPPSIILILYGIQAEVSIISLFLGGLVIGLATVVAYSVVIIILAVVRPDMMPRARSVAMAERLRSLIEVWPVLLLIAGVFGGITLGWFTPTEAAAIGAVFTIVIAVARRRLTRQALLDSAVDTILSTGSLFIVAVAANAFTRFIALTGITSQLAHWIDTIQFGEVAILLAISVLYLALGMFLDPIGALLLTLPVILPVLQDANISTVWFGILAAKLLEMGMLTPPVGLNVFVLHGVTEGRIPLETIFRGVMLFLLADVVLVGLLIVTREPFSQFLMGM